MPHVHTGFSPKSALLNTWKVKLSNSASAPLIWSPGTSMAGVGAAVPAAAAVVTATAGPAVARQQRLGTVALSYVGHATPLAGEYHAHDYDWQQHAEATAPLVEAQWAGAAAAVRAAAVLDAGGRPVSAVTELLLRLQKSGAGSSVAGGSIAYDTHTSTSRHGEQSVGGSTDGAVCSSSSVGPPVTNPTAVGGSQLLTGEALSSHAVESFLQGLSVEAAATAAAAVPAVALGPDASDSDSSSDAENEWELFYRAHPAARFFKERRYLLLEFPCLGPPSELQHVVEIGAGCGSSILPVLRAQPHTRATVSDVSSTCLQQLLSAMQHLGLDTQRVDAFTADGTSPELGLRLASCGADAALIMFTLSAVLPEGMLGMMHNAAAALRPGGLLCIRDHALYDMVQLRIPPAQCVARHLYKRGDGTLAYFYTTQELAGLALAAGLEVVECEYHCVVNRNRKTGQELRRAFVHGLFRKPE